MGNHPTIDHRVVNLEQGSLTALPDDVSTRTKGLHLSYNHFTTLSELSASRLPKLLRLVVDGNKITSLDPLVTLTRLTELSLTNNRISSLAPLSALSNLTRLSCEWNAISSLQPLAPLTRLAVLSCYQNSITTLKPLGRLPNLCELNCHDNPIRSLKPLATLTKLTSLICLNCALLTLSPITTLVSLQQLLCADNRISSLEPLMHLTGLRRLHVYDNPVTSLVCLTSLSRLRALHFSENQPGSDEFHQLRPDVLLQGLSMREYSAYNAHIIGLVMRRRRCWPHVKVQVLGDAGHGKSSLVRWLSGELVPRQTERPVSQETRSVDIWNVEITPCGWERRQRPEEATEAMLSELIRHEWAEVRLAQSRPDEDDVDLTSPRAPLGATSPGGATPPLPPIAAPKIDTEEAKKAIDSCLGHVMQTIDSMTADDVTEALHAALRPHLFVWDFGGQEEYYNTHHVLLSEGAVHAIVVRMEKNVETGRAELDGGRLAFWLDSVRVYCGSDAEVVVVGTHADTLSPEAREEWRGLVVASLTVERRLSQALSMAEQGQRVLVVSNTHGTHAERRAVQLVTRPLRREREVPLYYLVTFDMLRRAAKGALLGMLHMSDVYSMLAILHITHEEIRAALRFLDSMGLVLYRADAAQVAHVVFVQPQDLINALRLFIAPKHHLPTLAATPGYVTPIVGIETLRNPPSAGGLGLTEEQAASLWPVVRGVLLHFGLAFDDPILKSPIETPYPGQEEITIVPCQLSNDARDKAFERLLLAPNQKLAPQMCVRVAPFPLGLCGRLVVALQRAAVGGSNLYWREGCGVELEGCFVVAECDTAKKADTLGKKSKPPVIRIYISEGALASARARALRRTFDTVAALCGRATIVISRLACVGCRKEFELPAERLVGQWRETCHLCRPKPVFLPERWAMRWSVLCQQLVDELPAVALDTLRVAFNKRGATSVQDFFEKTNATEMWTGAAARRHLADLAGVLTQWANIEAVRALLSALSSEAV